MLFQKDKIDALVNKMVEVATNPDLVKKLGKNASKWVAENRDWGKLADILKEVYDLAFEKHHIEIKQRFSKKMASK